MPAQDDLALLLEKINLVRAQGEQCMGMVYDRPVSVWKNTFNAAAAQLGMPVAHIAPMQGGSLKDVQKHVDELVAAFVKAEQSPVIILVDTSGNRNLQNRNLNMAVSNYIQRLSERFPKAIYTQIITEGTGDPIVCLYSMKPKNPHPPGGIRPV